MGVFFDSNKVKSAVGSGEWPESVLYDKLVDLVGSGEGEDVPCVISAIGIRVGKINVNFETEDGEDFSLGGIAYPVGGGFRVEEASSSTFFHLNLGEYSKFNLEKEFSQKLAYYSIKSGSVEIWITLLRV